MGYNSGSVNVNETLLSSTNTVNMLVYSSTSVASGTNATLGTVGAGKQWRIVHMSISIGASGDATRTAVIKNDGTTIFAAGIYNTGNPSVNFNTSISEAIVVAAGKALTINYTGGAVANTLNINVGYVEVTV